MTALRDVVDLVYGCPFPSSGFRNGLDPNGLPVVRIRDVVPGFSNTSFVGRYDSNYIVEDGDMLIGMDGEFNLGRWRGGRALLNQRVCKVVPRIGKVEERYLFWALPRYLKAIEARTPFVTVKHLSAKALAAIELELPTLSEQRRIADILDKADAIRRKRKEAIALTEELLRSTFLEMFGDPVTNPKSWPVKPLGDVVDLFAGNSLPSGVEFSGQCDGYLLMKVGDMNIPGNEVEVAVAREWAATVPSAAVIAPAGAVVIPKRGGAIATNKKRVLTRAAALDPNLMAIAPRASLHLEFLRQWFEGIDLARLSNGSAVPQLNKKDLAPLTIPVPSSQSQAKFAEYAKRVQAMRARAERGQAEADALFSGLVAGAFAGGLSS